MHLESSTRSAMREQRGSVLLGSLMLIFILTAVGLAFFDITNVESRLVAGKQKEMKLLYAAEAGITRAHLYWEKGLTSAPCGTVTAMPTFDAVYTASPPTTTQLCAGETFDLGGGTTATYTVTAIKWDPGFSAADAARPCTVPTGADSATCVKVISTACVTPADPKAPCVRVEVNLAKVLTVSTSSEILETPTTFTSAKYPFFATDGIKLNTGEIVDSFDSSVGPYATSKCQAYACRPNPFVYINDSADENAKFSVPSAAVIYGNVTVAKDMLEIKSSGGNIVGDVTYDTADASCVGCTPAHVAGTVTGTTPIDPITLPPVGDCTNDPGAKTTDPTRNHSTGYTSASWLASQLIVNSGSYTYSDSGSSAGKFLTSAGSDITVLPGTYCFGLINKVAGSLSLPSSPSGPVVIKANQDAIFDGPVINTTLDASYFQILSSVNDTKKGIQVASGTNGYVYVYAPEAMILVNGNSDFFGAAMGRIIETSGSANLHFDKALGRPGKPLAGGITTTTTTTTTSTTTTTTTSYARQRWVLCPASGCA